MTDFRASCPSPAPGLMEPHSTNNRPVPLSRAVTLDNLFPAAEGRLKSRRRPLKDVDDQRVNVTEEKWAPR